MNEAFSRYIRLLCVVTAIIASGWLSYHCFGQTFGAQWMIIDDHTIALLLGPDRRFSLSEFIPALLETEVGRPGQEGRFRPAYYVMLLSEALLAGDNPGAWYGFRIFYFGCLLAGTWLACFRLVGFWGGLGIVLWISSVPIWQDVFARLGPGESYAAFGLGLYLPCLAFLLLDYGRLSLSQRGIVATVFLIANFILMGSKENWLALLLPNTLVAGVLFFKRCLDKCYTWSFILSTVYALAIGGILLAGLLNKGHVYASVYGDSFAEKPFGQALREYGAAAWQAFWIPSVVVFLVFVLLLGAVNFRSSLKPLAIRIGLASMFLVATFFVLFVWHMYFYAGNWMILKRYAFPGEVLIIFLWAGTAAIASYAARALQWRYVPFALSLGFLWFAYSQMVPRAWDQLRGASSVTVNSSHIFTGYLDKVHEWALHNPKTAIVVEITGSGVDWEFEPAISVIRFLTYYGLGNRLFLRLHGPTDPPTVPVLRDFMVRLSETGELDGLPRARVKPIGRLRKGRRCLSLGVRRNVETTCESLGPVPL